MKWTKETKIYMWADYYSDDGKWHAWDEEIKTGKVRRTKNGTRSVIKHVWFLRNRETNETLPIEFKTLKEVKEYVEAALN